MAVNDPMPTNYRRQPLKLSAGAVVALLLISGLHAAAIAGFLQLRASTPPPLAPQPIMVSFLTAVAPQPVVEPPPPPPPPDTPKPKPKPTIIASAQPTASAIEVPVEPEPVPEAAPAPQAPEAAPAAIVPPDFVAAYLNNPAPAYPPMSIRLREEGTVMLLVLVSAAGGAEQVQLETSSGFARLDAAAVDVVKRRWRFVPAKQGELAVAAWVRIPLSFELKQH